VRRKEPAAMPRYEAREVAQAAIDAASLALGSGTIDEAHWQQRVSQALAAAYLLEEDPRWQSGFDGDAQLWRQARELVLGACPSNPRAPLLEGCSWGVS
jgi:hypothetical protein